METDKVDEAKQDPRLSGAYIRTLVKHLTAKDPLDGDGGITKNLNENEEHQKRPTQPPQHKKQVRRRLHTNRPYQERLLNMAEARREIVTALKFHRASMKQQQQEEAANNLDLQSEQSPSLGQEKKTKSRRILGLYPSTTATATNSYSSLSSPPPVPCYWPISTIVPPPPPSYHDNLNFVLPSQTLGLNLNFQNFSNLDTHLYHKPMSMYSSSPVSSTPSTSSSAPVSAAAEELVVGKPKETVSNSSGGGGLHHHAMDDEEMEEIRSLGEQHQMEWNDTINLVTSARWSNFLKTMEIEAEEGDEYDGFDQVMEFPDWLMNANESSCLEQQFDDHFSDAYLQDPALPCMDIGEIEGMDGEWLA
ncbi:hypothetical protein Ccrd_020271 [Cynara cardunculus var. scolymus]|uniref:Hydroxyproline-rich glycoprotein family protein n=2 Tax=Cynara cardunculus var. scolymus TaxID=59895 RepID=A0A103Y2S5_CYNCS|nr:hypothetical protein Ccrd_020271 [Cynara cardunculus var. scolymus]